MPRAIDHLVIAVADPDAAADDLEKALGIRTTGGGEHPGVGTFNRLAFLGDAYLELIGVRDAAAAAGWPVGAATVHGLAAGEALATYALLEEDLDATVSRLRTAGSSIGPVTPGSRRRPDGEKVEWWTATFTKLGPDYPPFLIRHAYRGVEWGEAAMARRRAFVHPAGMPLTLSGLDLAVDDPAGLAETYAQELGIAFDVGSDGATADIGPHRVRLLPRNAVAAAAVVRVAGGDSPDAADLFGVRFELTAH